VLTTKALISFGEGREDFEVFGVAEGDGVLASVAASDDFKVLLVSFGGGLLLILPEFVVVFEHGEDLEALVGFEVVVDFAACCRMGELVMFREAGGGESKWASVGLD
jgi:hypothetical protein